MNFHGREKLRQVSTGETFWLELVCPGGEALGRSVAGALVRLEPGDWRRGFHFPDPRRPKPEQPKVSQR